MRQKLLFLLLIIVSCYGCSNYDVQPPIYTLKFNKQYDTYPDSCYFKRVECMQFYNDSLYILDAEQQRLAVASENFDKIKTITLQGRASNEIMAAYSFYLFNDTISVIDQGRMKYYIKDKYLSSIPINFMVKEERFYCDVKDFYMPYISKDYTFCTLSKHDSTEISRYGSLERIGSVEKTIRRNSRALLSCDKYIVTMPNAQPYLEYFDKQNKQMLGRYDLSSVEFMRENLDFIRQNPDEEKSFYVLTEDSYIANNNLFMLCNTFKKGFSANTILQIDLNSEPIIKAVYKLPNKHYSSICVNNRYLIAFNKHNSSFEYFRIDSYMSIKK